MRITVVTGFFLPMPPDAGGAVEKSWYGLAGEFVRQGHEVTIISRRWRGWPDRETREGIRHLRVRGYNHTSALARNLWLDFLWSVRVTRALPAADFTIVNCVSLPILLRWFRRRAGRVVVSSGRMPKGQFRLYGDVDLVLAASSPVRDAVIAENPRLAPRIRICGYPIHWESFAQPRAPRQGPVTIGFVGRIHREKGLDLFAAAIALLAQQQEIPPWRVMLCGPADIPRGGSGPAYAARLREALARAIPADRIDFRAAEFDETRLAAIYRSLDIFCYPSVAIQGETFGVSVAEAMAAGAAPVVSNLPCFTDFVQDGRNGCVFDAFSPGAAENLKGALRRLLVDPAGRAGIATAAAESVRRYDYPNFAREIVGHLSEFGARHPAPVPRH